jgi:hypothetical protein
MACPKCGGMVMVTPPGPASPLPASPTAAHSPTPRPAPIAPIAPRSSDTGETKPDLSHPLRPQLPINTAAPLKADAFDDVDVLLGDVPARTMVPTPTGGAEHTAAAARPA